MSSLFRSLVFNDNGQDIAEYAVIVAVILIKHSAISSLLTEVVSLRLRQVSKSDSPRTPTPCRRFVVGAVRLVGSHANSIPKRSPHRSVGHASGAIAFFSDLEVQTVQK